MAGGSFYPCKYLVCLAVAADKARALKAGQLNCKHTNTQPCNKESTETAAAFILSLSVGTRQ